jgi:hypothetical protein
MPYLKLPYQNVLGVRKVPEKAVPNGHEEVAQHLKNIKNEVQP